MEKLTRRRLIGSAAGVGVVGLASWYGWRRWGSTATAETLTLATAPYQDLAMIVNAPLQGFDRRHGFELELITVGWEEILPAVAAATNGVDVGFGSLAEYLATERHLNEGSDDPIRFCCPLYVFNGGGFVTTNPDIPDLTTGEIDNARATSFLSRRIGAQRNSIYEMVIYSLARRASFATDRLQLTDIQLNDGLLAVQGGALDIAAAGLTQVTEAQRNGGRLVLTMDDLGFADITGFICRQSLLDTRSAAVQGLVRAWFDSVAYVYADLDAHSEASREYLNRTAATRYSLEEYRSALAQEFLPASVSDARAAFLADDGRYPIARIAADMSEYLRQVRGVDVRNAADLELGLTLGSA